MAGSPRRSPMAYLLIGFLKAYRIVISPLYGNVCRYYPSCSAYALTAVQVHGAAKGSWLAAKRLARCHPWTRGGYDPVPGTERTDEDELSPGAIPMAAPTTESTNAYGSEAGDDRPDSRGSVAGSQTMQPGPAPDQPEQSGRGESAGRGNGVN